MAKIKNFSLMQQLLDTMQNGSSPPYFAEYLLPSSTEVAIDLQKHPGLAFYCVIQSIEPHQHVATAWRSEEFYSRDGERLRVALQAPPPTTRGAIARSVIPGKPFWKRMSPLTILLTSTTIAGAVDSVYNHYDTLFDSPSLMLQGEKSHADLTEGSEFVETMVLTNNLPIPHRNVRLTATWTAEGSAPTQFAPLKVAPASLTYMAVGAKQEITVSGVAPGDGKYRIAFEVNAKAGRATPAESLPFFRQVTVWPESPIGPLNVKRIQEPRAALLNGQLSVGHAAPNGLKCELQFLRAAGLQRDTPLLEFPGRLAKSAHWRQSNSALQNEVAVLQWTTGMSVPEHTLIPFKVALRAESNIDWQQVAQFSKARCYYREEKSE